uniref:tyrosinase n=1 Tax=Agaricus blazei TaxID=79798 RepID=Q2WG54_9AGAR|nr:polyphenoloxidase [Agaricus blazei]
MSHLHVSPLGGGVQPRLEINNFVKDNHQFSLYVQALDRMYATSQGDFSSYFQVAGVHGYPLTAYDGAVGPQQFSPQNQWTGYCTHGSTLFPTWHRPYVLMVEQILSGHAQQIADTYAVDKDAWKQAATQFRHPYWDWAANSVPPPEVISLPKVTITTPDGKNTSVNNPLMRYTFHPVSDGGFHKPFSQWSTTLRQPDSTRSNAQENVAQLKSVLKNAQSSITQATYDMFNRVTTWAHFSSHTESSGGSTSNSIEAIHDNIHVLVGGRGHMSDPSVAAFDPIFFLHHANVDRMIALWSAIRYNVWTSPGDAGDGTFTLAYEAAVDDATDLTPWRKTDTEFWKSNEVTTTQSFGYTYPEFIGLDMNNRDAVNKTISQKVAQLYGPKGTSHRRSFEEDLSDLEQIHGHSHSRRHQRLAKRGRLAQLLKGIFSDWSAQIKFNRHEAGQSFSVCLFLGDVPEDPSQWLVSPNLVGTRHAFVHPTKNDHVAEEIGFIPINPWIAEHTGLLSFAVGLVKPLLIKSLQWRVLLADGTPADLESLEVTILEIPSEFLDDAPNPVSGPAKYHKDITHGKRGGCKDA